MLKNPNCRILTTITLSLFLSLFASGQDKNAGAQSITTAELRDHIYFLASDYLAGRVGTSAEYKIAAQYVASQFASGGVEPLITKSDGKLSYLQDVPFVKNVYGNDIKWIAKTKKGSFDFLIEKDFKILFSQELINRSLDVVFVGYGIEEPGSGWNDFEGLDVEGKMIICLPGAPMKDGKPVLPQELHDKYNAMGGFQSKFGTIMSKHAAVVIMAGTTTNEEQWNSIRSNFRSEQYIYQSPTSEKGGHRIPVICYVKPALLETLFEGQKFDPSTIAEKGLKKYAAYQLKDVAVETVYPIISSQEIVSKNVVGIVRGTDPALASEYIVVGAHLDHVAPVNGEVCNGADDNASGTAGMIEIAEAMAATPARRPVIFVAYTAEEMGLNGSHYFINSGSIDKKTLLFNVNLDMIGRSSPDNSATRAHYAVTDKKYQEKLGAFINEVNASTVNFPLIIDNDDDSPGGSDHMSFISEDIPAFFFFSGMYSDLHTPGDDADKIDYDKAMNISQLAYYIAYQLANMDRVPDFK